MTTQLTEAGQKLADALVKADALSRAAATGDLWAPHLNTAAQILLTPEGDGGLREADETRRANYAEGRRQHWQHEAERLAWMVRHLGGDPEDTLTPTAAPKTSVPGNDAGMREALMEARDAANDLAQACVDEGDSKGAGALQFISGFISDRLAALSPPTGSAGEDPKTPDAGVETDALVDRFAVALKAKLRFSEAKHGWQNGWLKPDWRADCQRDLSRHIAKGDPIDVAGYAAFCWHHGWPTAPVGEDETGVREAVRERIIGELMSAAWAIGTAPSEAQMSRLHNACEGACVALRAPQPPKAETPAGVGDERWRESLREGFEAWIKGFGFPTRRRVGSYENSHTGMAWNAWHAAHKDAALSLTPAARAGDGVSCEAVEAASAAFYDTMIGSEREFWPHHEGWAGKDKAFKAKVRSRMRTALEAAFSLAPAARAGDGVALADALADLREASDAATPGEWIILSGVITPKDDDSIGAAVAGSVGNPGKWSANRAFIIKAVKFARDTLASASAADRGTA